MWHRRIVVGGTNGTFTLSFGTGPGNTTTALSNSDPTLDVDMQAALDALTTIGGVGGSVTVTANPALTEFTIVFGGSLARAGNGTEPPLPALVPGNLTGDATVATSNPPELVINAVISDPLGAGTGTTTAGLIKAGGGALQLTNTETYNGPTTVTGGLLSRRRSPWLRNAADEHAKRRHPGRRRRLAATAPWDSSPRPPAAALSNRATPAIPPPQESLPSTTATRKRF